METLGFIMLAAGAVLLMFGLLFKENKRERIGR